MGNKQFYGRERSARDLGAAVTQHKAVIADRVTTLFCKSIQGNEKPPDLELFLTLCARQVLGRGDVVGITGLKYEQELQDDDEPRRRRDAAEEQLLLKVQSTRNVVGGAYGEAGLALFGMTELYGVGPDALSSYARNLIAALEQPNLKLPPSNAAGLSIDPKAVAADLKPVYERLRGALEDVAREKSEASTALIAKDKAIAEHDFVFSKVASIVELFARLADLPEVADRIRPSPSSPGVLAQLPAEEPAAPTAPAKAPIAEGLPGADPFIK